MRCTRIWWVRPVRRSSSSSASPASRGDRAVERERRRACGRRSARPPDRHALAILGDRERWRRRSRRAVVGAPVDDGEVELVHLALGEGAREPLIRLLGARHREHSGGAEVEPVDDAGAARVADRGDLGKAVEQEVDQRAVGAPRARVHRDIRRLVEDDQVIVLPEHAQRATLRRERGSRTAARPDLHSTVSPAASGARTAARRAPRR